MARLVLLISLLAPLAGCTKWHDVDADADADTDTDSEEDAAGDGDGDSDAEGDVDADRAVDAESDGDTDDDRDVEAPCLPGIGEVFNVTEVNSGSVDGTPSISHDGLTLYFQSNRSSASFDLFAAVRPAVDEPFREPIALTALSSEEIDTQPGVAADGLSLFFASTREGCRGETDIWVTRRDATDLPFGPPSCVMELSTESFDDSPSLSADGETLFFASNRPDPRAVGGVDLWLATRPSPSASFETPRVLGLPNSEAEDGAPSVAFDGGVLLFQSNRPGGQGGRDIWVSTRNAAGEFGLPVNLVDLNTEFDEVHPSLSGDGRTLFFSSDRPGGLGNNDIWAATVECR